MIVWKTTKINQIHISYQNLLRVAAGRQVEIWHRAEAVDCHVEVGTVLVAMGDCREVAVDCYAAMAQS